MHMPETAVDVDDLSQSREDEIGCPRERADMKTVAIPERMDQPSNCELRSRILRLDRRHDARPIGGAEGIHHIIADSLEYR